MLKRSKPSGAGWTARAYTARKLRREGGFSVVIRAGALPGAANYTGRPNYDERIRAPLGLLGFGDTFQHHKLFYKRRTTGATWSGSTTAI